ncbi:alpha/beta hydrolase [Diaminobutyricibacter tongyongensis]|uniref:Alpha/beta hydrolase n=1 Tax=Leifsonia tongyongensis TaxID=1268043 RepID=A0A6L9XZ43_9MICO|nr:alpha/beta hydrolase [Diaminobutyricibacter tongyongensis]NEN06691.1 alpha/beta hydrolase [Diaminobutyricibacter tongyongensis]
MSTDPTVVLVHGAFADGASWAPVTRILLDQGLQVRVPPVPNRSLLTDSAYIKEFVEQIDGPALLAGHSYGGAVLTIAGTAENVVGLVFVAAFALDEGETITKLQAGFSAPELAQHLVTAPVTLPDGSAGTDVSVDIAAFPDVFTGTLDPKIAQVLAVSQRPIASVAFDEPAPAAAWKTKPSWGIVSANDHCINPDVERFGYKRAGTQFVELPSPHLAMQTHPADVAKTITGAVAQLG